ncbi:sec14 cytosolic factor isoform X2 [Manihot esculenta]|uniref:sec14 cytosolic factor isoform X2 n=1 Tax=Manihot esculenta TaxID=3983 RepID=UPI001CC65FCF|nr:sec14 cytosolic factor isoform X2 [Manihot esculenta]
MPFMAITTVSSSLYFLAEDCDQNKLKQGIRKEEISSMTKTREMDTTDDAHQAQQHKATSKGMVEQTKTSLLRAAVERQDPSSKGVDDSTLRRFLRARDLDVQRASAMFLKYLKWRREFVPNGSISPSEVSNEIAQNKVFVQGTDKKGRPIMVAFGSRHYQNKESSEELKLYVLDKICARTSPEQEKFVVLADLQGWGYANSDVRGCLAALAILQVYIYIYNSVLYLWVHLIFLMNKEASNNGLFSLSIGQLQDYYPERLGKLFIVNAPYIFMAVWKIIYPFIDNNTKKKIVFVENKKLKSTLLEDIDESLTPDIYGGRLPLVPVL